MSNSNACFIYVMERFTRDTLKKYKNKRIGNFMCIISSVVLKFGRKYIIRKQSKYKYCDDRIPFNHIHREVSYRTFFVSCNRSM